MDQNLNLPPQPDTQMNVILVSSLIVLIITLIVYIISRLLNIYGINLNQKKNSDNIILNTKIGIGSTL